MKREIQYKIERNADYWFVTITKQTYVCELFTNDGSEFYVGDFVLASVSFPENQLDDVNTVFVRGNDIFSDNKGIIFDTNQELNIFIDMVNEYNETGGVL